MTTDAAPGAHWVHDIDPILIHITDRFGIRYYGLAYVLAFLSAAALLTLYWRRGRSPVNSERVWDLMFAIVAGVVIGGRLGSFLLYHPEDLAKDPLSLFRLWEGGMASHGGFLGVTIALFWFARHYRFSFLTIADLVVTTAPWGLFLGRVANFINGELWGNPSSVSWAVIFPLKDMQPRHPSQIYEALCEGLLLFIYVQIRFWKSNVVRATPGRLSGEFLLAYAAARAFCEQFREPDAELILGMSRGTFYSLFLIVGGLILILRPKTVKR